MSVAPQKINETGFRVLAGILIGIFAILSLRLWYLQVIQGNANLEKSNRFRTYSIPIPAPRGNMYDRSGRVLVANRLSYTVTVVPEEALASPETLGSLAQILGIKVQDLRDDLTKRLADKNRNKDGPVRLSRDVEPEIAVRIEEDSLDLAGVSITREPVRDYVYGSMASHAFGYIHEISAQELASAKDAGYRQGDIIGKTGLEKTYESYLRGENGSTEIEKDKSGRLLRVLREVYPTPGQNLNLTIDRDLQLAAEKALVEQLNFLQRNSQYVRARSGAVLAMDPRNGDILAMVSYPSFDPNLFVGSIPPEVSRALFSNPLHPFSNRVLQGAYAPGSTFKPITVSAALETGKASLRDQFYCGGIDTISKKQCWIWSSQRRGHGVENIVDGLKNSCNIVMFDLARRVGIDVLSRYARQFGLGKPTGLDLHPGEQKGLVPDKEYKKQNFKGDLAVWRPNETLDLSIGQGFLLMTPLQLAQMYSAIANGGTLYRPRLVTSITTPDGNVSRRFRPEATGKIGVSEKTLSIVMQGLSEVVSEGTGAGVFRGFPLDKYPVAGKTGTAQRTGYDNNGWYVAFAPADKASIVVVVLIEQGGSGSGGAGPVARKVMDAYFKVEKTASKASAPKAAAPSAVQTPTGASNPAGTPGQQQPETPAAQPQTAPDSQVDPNASPVD